MKMSERASRDDRCVHFVFALFAAPTPTDTLTIYCFFIHDSEAFYTQLISHFKRIQKYIQGVSKIMAHTSWSYYLHQYNEKRSFEEISK